MTLAIYTQYTKIILGSILDAKLKISKCKHNFMFDISIFLLTLEQN
jgi:hypothetical protein